MKVGLPATKVAVAGVIAPMVMGLGAAMRAAARLGCYPCGPLH